MPAPRFTRAELFIERSGVLVPVAPVRLQHIERLDDADRILQHLAGDGGIAGLERVAPAELQPVHAEPVGQLVHRRLAGDRALRHAEAAEGAGRRAVGEIGRAARPGMRHDIGAGRMHRHAVGDGRAPARIGAGIQLRMRPEAGERAGRIAADPRLDQRRVALGGGRHALRPGVDVGDRLAGEPRRQRDQRMDVEIELAAEAAADRARDQAHRLLRQVQDLRQVVAMLERILGRDVHFHRVALALRPAGFRLDIGVLDEAGLVFDLGDVRRLGERGRRHRRR